jgi:predicted polyphosphate/ATP-dependent NAD kinase
VSEEPLSFVGVIANPASGKDIRRLVAFGSVFDNQEKVRIVRRLILGLLAVGVEKICFMPDYFGIVSRAVEPLKITIPVFPVNFKATASQDDSIRAAAIMHERMVDVIVTLGGDGTNRAVAKGAKDTPLLPISTGTNNVFPYMVEATVAGLAAGLLARGLVPVSEGTYRSTKLEVRINDLPMDLALVDAVVYDDPFIGSRAVWDMTKVKQVFLNRSQPDSIGLSSIGGRIRSIRAEDPSGLSLILGENGRKILAPVAPGMIRMVGVEEETVMQPDHPVEILATPSVLALDGEREVEIAGGVRASMCLKLDGPWVVDVKKTMTAALERKCMIEDVSVIT